jgi:transcriptional regulator of acetoin/glycerol metabolism
VRELRNLLERAMVCAAGPILQASDFGLGETATAAIAAPASLEEVERRHIALVLEGCGGNVTHAARVLDIDRVTLYNKIRKYGLREPAGA